MMLYVSQNREIFILKTQIPMKIDFETTLSVPKKIASAFSDYFFFVKKIERSSYV
jgi:hypothetical protein